MRLRTTLGLALGLCVFAITAAPALASPEFKANAVGKEFSPTTPAKSVGKGTTLQNFHFGAFHIECEAAHAKSLVPWEKSKTYYTEIKYTKCTSEAKLGGNTIHLKTYFKTPVDIEYHANGFAETGSESESEVKLLNPGAVELKVPSLKCVIQWPAQTVPVKAIKNPEGEYSAVTYENEEISRLNAKNEPTTKFPSGFQKVLNINNELKGMEWELEEGQCEDFKSTAGKTGSYIGSLQEQIPGGNLYIGESEEVI